MVPSSLSNINSTSTDTVNGIAAIYSRLQAVIDKKQQNSNAVNPEAKFIPYTSSLPMSPRSSSPTPLCISRSATTGKALPTPRSSSSDEKQTCSSQAPEECPCEHILENEDSIQCSLCRRVIPIMEQLQHERDAHKLEIAELEARVQEEQKKISKQLEEIEALQATVADFSQRLDAKDEELRALKYDMELLNDKYVDEIERVAEIQHSKDMVESELEDLSRRLFEEANGMVANEKREKHELEMVQKQLEKQLQETQERLAAEQMQLKELRQKMEEMAEEQRQLRRASAPAAALFKDGDYASGAETTTSDADQATTCSEPSARASSVADPILLAEFQDFVKFGGSVPLKKLHTIPFIKHCQVEDVEPCLRFGTNARLSARKINDAIVMNTCFVEETPAGYLQELARRPPDMPLRISASKTLLWERISNGGNPVNYIGACQACGRQDQDELPYRFRISYFDDWACIDRYCRDRLVAVCEFYVFIRNVRQGYYSSRSVADLYQEATRLRLQMFYARYGFLLLGTT